MECVLTMELSDSIKRHDQNSVHITTTTFLLILFAVLFSVPAATFISLKTISDRFLGNLTCGLLFETVRV
jgi:hypothetical protein